MALIPTLVALGVGVWLGHRWGGNVGNVLDWRPELYPVGISGLVLYIVSDVASFHGSPAVLLSLLSTGLLVGFAVANVRTGGMVLVAAGMGLNFLVTLLNWGTPVSGSALVSSGVVDTSEQLEGLVLSGGSEVADGAFLGFLGGVIPLPWGQVLSIGDLLWLAGLALVTASVMRRYVVRGRRGGRRPRGYSDSLSALSRGPAPRRGPGLHPSRLGSRRPGRSTR